MDKVHQVGLPQLQQGQIHDQVQHNDFQISSIHLLPITKNAFMSGYTKDREFKEALKSNHDKYVLRNGLSYVKTRGYAFR